MRELWTKKPTYEEVLQQLEKDYKIKLPNRVALEFYDSFAMSKFREQQQMITVHGAAADEQRDEAMGQAAAESGIGKQELLSFAQQMGQQSQQANEQLRRDMRDTADRHDRGMQEQAQEFGRQMMEQKVREDKRMEFVERHMANLQCVSPQTPFACIP